MFDTMQFDVMQFVTAAVTIGVRMSSLLVFTPFPGGEAAPPALKAGLALALTALLYPVYGKSMPALTGANVVSLIGNEMLIGLLMGLAVTFVFEAAQVAGQVVGTQVGFSLVNIIDPMTQVETPVMATLHQLLVLLIFLQLNVHHWLLRGAADSFAYLPPNGARVSGEVVETLFRDAGGIWVAAVEIAAPILFATVMADVALGFIGKASPQLHVLFLSLPAKTMLAMVVWVSALALWPMRFETYFGEAIHNAGQLLHLAR